MVKYDDGTVLSNCTITTGLFVCLFDIGKRTFGEGHLIRCISCVLLQLSCEDCLNWIEKFPQGCLKLEYDDRPGCAVETVTNAAESGASDDLS